MFNLISLAYSSIRFGIPTVKASFHITFLTALLNSGWEDENKYGMSNVEEKTK